MKVTSEIVYDVISSQWQSRAKIRMRVTEKIGKDNFSDAKLYSSLRSLESEGLIEKTIVQNPRLARKNKSEARYRRCGSAFKGTMIGNAVPT